MSDRIKVFIPTLSAAFALLLHDILPKNPKYTQKSLPYFIIMLLLIIMITLFFAVLLM